MRYSIGNSIHFVVAALLLIGIVPLQGCSTASPTSSQCGDIPDPESSIRCLNRVMFGDSSMGEGIAIGAVGGAVLGGAVAFAASGGHASGQIVRGVVTGGIVGGVTGGLLAYLNDLRARTAGDAVRAANMNAANMSAFNRQLLILNAKLEALAQRSQTPESAKIIQITDNRISDTTNIYVEATKKLPSTPEASEERDQLEHLSQRLSQRGFFNTQ